MVWLAALSLCAHAAHMDDGYAVVSTTAGGEKTDALLPEALWWRWLGPTGSPATAPAAASAPLPIKPPRLPLLRSPFAAAFAERAQLAISAGDISVAADDLLFAGYQRPGAAARFSRNESQQITLFSVVADPSKRYYGNIVTASLPSERSAGVRATAWLLGNVRFSAGYLGGETTYLTPDTVLLSDPHRYGGDSWNMALDSRLFNEAMRIYLEYAESNFDRDGLDRGIGAVRGHATQAGFKLASGVLLPSGPFDYWTSDWRYRAVDGRYTSIANPLLPSDLESLGSWFRFGIGRLSGELEWRAEENNLAQALRPTQRAEKSALALTFAPVDIGSEQWLWRRIGIPSLSTEVGQTRRRKLIPDGLTLARPEPMRQTDELRTSLNFSRRWLDWSLRWQQIDQHGGEPAVAHVGGARFTSRPDRQRELVGIKFGMLPNERVDIDLSMLWNTRWDGALEETSQRRHYGIDARFGLVPDQLSLQLHYRNGRDFDTLSHAGLVEDHLQFNNSFLQLSWHALKAGSRNPGLDIFVRGHYNEQINENIDQTTEFWSAHLGVKLSWENGN